MSHQKLLDSLIKKKKQKQMSSNIQPLTQNNNKGNTKKTVQMVNALNNEVKKQEPPSLKEILNLVNMFNPEHLRDDEDIVCTTSQETQALDKMYIKQLDENPNKYLFCKQSGMYLPVGYRYAGYHTSKDNGNKIHLYTRKNESGYFVVHCLGKKMEKHENYDVYQPIDLTSQLPSTIMQMVRDGVEIHV
jgi:hypothetical protein